MSINIVDDDSNCIFGLNVCLADLNVSSSVGDVYAKALVDRNYKNLPPK